MEVGKRTINALARQLLKVKSAKSLSGWMGKCKKRTESSSMDSEMINEILIHAHELGKAHLDDVKMANCDQFILHQGSLVLWDSICNLIHKMDKKEFDDKEAQKLYKSIHCAIINKLHC